MRRESLSKLLVIALFMTAFLPASASAYGHKWDVGRDWSLLNGSGWSNTSEGVATSSDGSVVYTAGANGVRISTDFGATWGERNTGLLLTYGASDIATSADGSVVTMVQNGGFIWVSTDFGISWQQRTNVPSACWPTGAGLGVGQGQWQHVAMSSSGQYIVLAECGRFFRSADFGATFIQSAIGNHTAQDSVPDIEISADGQRIIIATNYTLKVYLSFNSGASFSEVSALPNVQWSTAAISGDGNTLIAAAYLGNIWVSHDAGSTWKESVIDLNGSLKNWHAAAISYDGTYSGITRDGYTILTSDNGGSSWEVRSGSPSAKWTGIDSSNSGLIMYAGSHYDHGYGGVYKSVPTQIWTDAGTVTLLLDPCWDSYSFTSVKAASVILMPDTASAVINSETSTYTYFSETDTALWGADYNYGSTQDQQSCQETQMNGTVTLSRSRFTTSYGGGALSETTTNTTDFLQYIGNTENASAYSGIACGNMNAAPRNTANVTSSCTSAIQTGYTLLTYAAPVQVRDSSVKVGVLGQGSGKIYTFVKVRNSAISGAPNRTTWVATETFTVTSA